MNQSRPARGLSRRDPATFQPVYLSKHVARARAASEWVMVIVVAISVALLIKHYVLEAYEIPSESMVPTLLVHDKVVVNKLAYDYSSLKYGDVVVFKAPPGESDPSIKNLIKRVVGLPGDTLEGRDGVLFRNGVAVSEPYLPPGTVTDELPPTKVPAGMVFFMGDNRGDSADSRVFGPVSQHLVIGRTEGRVWPLNRIDIF